MSQRNRTKPLPAVRGQYNINGYDVWIGGQLVYAAGNYVQDSTQYATCEQDRLPLRTIRKFCIKTAREIAMERGGRFAGVERVTDPCPTIRSRGL